MGKWYSRSMSGSRPGAWHTHWYETDRHGIIRQARCFHSKGFCSHLLQPAGSALQIEPGMIEVAQDRLPRHLTETR